MQRDIRKSDKRGKTANLKISVFYNEKTGHIRIGLPHTITTVTDDPTSKRFHPNLFAKLAEALKNAGKPGPPVRRSRTRRRRRS
jgi:hypothetical protein